MEKMLGMSRKPSPQSKIQFDSIPDLKLTIESAAERMPTVKFQGRKLRPGPLLNAIVAYFLRLDDEHQREVATAGLADLEALLEIDESVFTDKVAVISPDMAIEEYRRAVDAVKPQGGPPPKRKNYRKVSVDATLVDDLVPTRPPRTAEKESGGEDGSAVIAERNAPRPRKR